MYLYKLFCGKNCKSVVVFCFNKLLLLFLLIESQLLLTFNIDRQYQLLEGRSIPPLQQRRLSATGHGEWFGPDWKSLPLEADVSRHDGDLIENRPQTLNIIVVWGSRGFRVVLNLASLIPKDASHSDNCTLIVVVFHFWVPWCVPFHDWKFCPEIDVRLN